MADTAKTIIGAPKRRKVLWTVLANMLVLGVIWGGLEFACWSVAVRPFDSFLPSWRFNHVRKPNSTIGPRKFFSANGKMIRYFNESDRWHFNNQGWLGEEDVSPYKEPGVYRIFYLGDSFVEGHTVPEYTLPRLVGEKLAARFGAAGVKLELINAATSSYSPTLHYLLLRYKILGLAPDMVVINIDMTDDFDEWKYRSRLIVDDEGNPEAVPFRDVVMAGYMDTEFGAVRASFWTRVMLFLHTRSYVFNVLQHLMADWEHPADQESPSEQTDLLYRRWAWCEREWDSTTAENVERMFDVLRKVAKLCEENHVKLALASVAHYTQFHGDKQGKEPPSHSSRPHEALEQLAEELSVPFLNARQALSPAVSGTPVDRYYYPDDIHFNERGNELWAEAHMEFLLEPGHELLPRALYEEASPRTGELSLKTTGAR